MPTVALDDLLVIARRVERLKKDLASERQALAALAVRPSVGPHKAKGFRCDLCQYWWVPLQGPNHHPNCALAKP
jgi:hypothetical protein